MHRILPGSRWFSLCGLPVCMLLGCICAVIGLQMSTKTNEAGQVRGPDCHSMMGLLQRKHMSAKEQKKHVRYGWTGGVLLGPFRSLWILLGLLGSLEVCLSPSIFMCDSMCRLMQSTERACDFCAGCGRRPRTTRWCCGAMANSQNVTESIAVMRSHKEWALCTSHCKHKHTEDGTSNILCMQHSEYEISTNVPGGGRQSWPRSKASINERAATTESLRQCPGLEATPNATLCHCQWWDGWWL